MLLPAGFLEGNLSGGPSWLPHPAFWNLLPLLKGGPVTPERHMYPPSSPALSAPLPCLTRSHPPLQISLYEAIPFAPERDVPLTGGAAGGDRCVNPISPVPGGVAGTQGASGWCLVDATQKRESKRHCVTTLESPGLHT